ncbi:MAG: hypothetical protein ABIA47_02360 [bacterium]
MNDEQPIAEDLPKKQKSVLFWILIPAFIFLLVCAFAVGALMTLDRIAEPFEDDVEDVEDAEEEEEVETSVTAGDSFSVDWLSFGDQIEVNANAALEESLYDDIPFELVQPGTDYSIAAYKVGTIAGGKYDGSDLTIQIATLVGMGDYYKIFYIIDLETGTDVILENYASEITAVFTSALPQESASDVLTEEDIAQIGDRLVYDSSVIDEFEHESEVTSTEGVDFNLRGLWHRLGTPVYFPVSDYAVVATLEDGTELRMYNVESESAERLINQFFTVREDGRLVWYDINIPFWTAGEDFSGRISSTMGVPVVTWEDGTVNTEEYMKGELGGCGYSSITYVRDADEIGELRAAGSFVDDSGESHMVNEPASYSTEYFTGAYDFWVIFNEGATFEDYTSGHPYFYWQDNFGRWIEFRRSDLLPPAECGKPVIYLYPESKTRIDVQLAPQGGFSVTEPEYGDGWSVIAYPDGNLKNLADGENYPYLFWEGRGDLYSEPENYWVVPQGAVPKFLTKTLARLGLNGQETNDFMEFWVPRMQEADWYKIGFHGTEVMDAIAPMSLSVEPDTVIRILMDYSELDAPILSNPPFVLPAPEREGFTVIEWGGVLR